MRCRKSLSDQGSPEPVVETYEKPGVMSNLLLLFFIPQVVKVTGVIIIIIIITTTTNTYGGQRRASRHIRTEHVDAIVRDEPGRQ